MTSMHPDTDYNDYYREVKEFGPLIFFVFFICVSIKTNLLKLLFCLLFKNKFKK